MKIVGLSVIIIFFGCGTEHRGTDRETGNEETLPSDDNSQGKNGGDSEEPGTPQKELSIEEAINLILPSEMEKELTHITDDKFKGRLSATSGNEEVQEYLINHLKSLGIEGGINGAYKQEFTMSKGPTSGQKTSNIIGLIPGNDPVLKEEYIVIGAHMDHAGTMALGYTCSWGTSGSNNICNGADDNGSGTISVFNIAKALAKTRHLLKRSVVIMWFSGEEEGLLGSYFYTKNPIFPLDKTVYMINLDMVGYIHTHGNVLSGLGGGTSSTGTSYMRAIDEKYDDFELSITQSAGGGSDHVPFMSKGIPGVFFNTGVNNNKNYHRTSDTPDKISYDGMAYVAKMAFELVHKMSSHETSFSLAVSKRKSFVTEEEMKQSCHHLAKNPYLSESLLDFRNGNNQ